MHGQKCFSQIISFVGLIGLPTHLCFTIPVNRFWRQQWALKVGTSLLMSRFPSICPQGEILPSSLPCVCLARKNRAYTRVLEAYIVEIFTRFSSSVYIPQFLWLYRFPCVLEENNWHVIGFSYYLLEYWLSEKICSPFTPCSPTVRNIQTFKICGNSCELFTVAS